MRVLLIVIAAIAGLASPVAADPVAGVETALRSVVRIEPGWSRDGDDTGLSRGLGSGFVVDDQGRIATNAHVVGEADTVIVVTPSGERRVGRVVGRDPLTDIALIEPEGSALAPALEAAEGIAPRPGQRVYAIGSPIAFPFSVTEGIVSGVGRAYDPAWPVDFIQHDAAINPGSSGGPLIDADGRLIGMNTATPGETLFDIGIGLAIPAEQVVAIAGTLAREGALERGGLGVVVRGADAAMMEAMGVDHPHGLLVDEVRPDSPAGRAGLAPGDVILSVRGADLRYPRDLSAALLDTEPGETVELSLASPGGAVRRLTVRLGAAETAGMSHGRISQAALTTREQGARDVGMLFVTPVSGIEGAMINEVSEGSLAAAYGIRRGDILLAVDGRPVATPAAAIQALEAGGDLAVLRLLRPGRGVRHLALPLTTEAAERRPPGLPTDLGSGPL